MDLEVRGEGKGGGLGVEEYQVQSQSGEKVSSEYPLIPNEEASAEVLEDFCKGLRKKYLPMKALELGMKMDIRAEPARGAWILDRTSLQRLQCIGCALNLVLRGQLSLEKPTK